ncbi:MAG: DNA-3-methyladenine glycosylase [Alphaproteobacteria bacterium]|jgi:DNA-3-methyladenine glycosylase I|nr:DNA-3-methyladenine glycosylase [Alphaproteobacteria bacterium]PPR12653.1 MAG: DNA-3-methyladenine glycosylase 1 [Alphaproteobacteria bacterium MarineAlpha12_Bin1]|tara:strand:- start:6319 stop:6858 length:540 start_codon:yes stop_codon:yes gene_type:complete
MPDYCDIAPEHEIHGPYHDNEYGFPEKDDSKLFERLVLEINQAGLSWLTVLKKRDNFYRAFNGYNIELIANYGDYDKKRLMSDNSIIRNKLKINSVIYNANKIMIIKKEHSTFSNWLNNYHPLKKSQWVALFKDNFKFTGKEITGEFLMSTGYLSGAHREDCPIFKKILELKPPWMNID